MILVIEDEPGIVDFIERGLERAGFEVSSRTDGADGLALALNPTVDLVILDLMLPSLSGGQILSRLSFERPDLPVIVLTARGGVQDRIKGLDAGAVDYLVKPFALDELIARVRAQLRSARRGETTITAGGITIDLPSRRVRVGDLAVQFSTTEFELLTYLMRNRGTVLSRAQILRSVWGYDHDPGTNVLDVYVGYVRRKLGASGAAGRIVTVRSLGYRFDGDDD
jgi:two-component system, OmpR family, copper resistance phosphate regulon response regulator CusR